MANFYPWIDTSNKNVMSENDFKNDSQRSTGFEAGQAASSKRVNSALRQANLFVAALANIILGNDTTLNLTSSLNAVQTKLASSHPFNIPIQQAGTGSAKSIIPKNVIANENVVGSNVLVSLVYGTNNKVETNYSACFGTSNELISKTYNSPMFLFGSNLYNESTTHAKFVTGYYNKDCGDCVRETGAGTSESNRKTVEKLDEEGNLYVKSLHLSNNIGKTDDPDDAVLSKTSLKNLIKLANNLAASWIEANISNAKLPSPGTYHIRGYYNGTRSTYFDFGLVYFDSTHGIELPTRGAKSQSTDPDIATNHLISGFILSNGTIELVVDEQTLNDSVSGYSGTKIWYKKVW